MGWNGSFFLRKGCLENAGEGSWGLIMAQVCLGGSLSKNASLVIRWATPPPFCPSAKTASGDRDSFKLAVCGRCCYRGRENTAGTTHFLLPALLESVRISFSEALGVLRVTRVAKVWPLNVGHF